MSPFKRTHCQIRLILSELCDSKAIYRQDTMKLFSQLNISDGLFSIKINCQMTIGDCKDLQMKTFSLFSYTNKPYSCFTNCSLYILFYLLLYMFNILLYIFNVSYVLKALYVLLNYI